MPHWHLAAATPQDIDDILTIDREAFKRPWQRQSFSDELNRKDAHSYVVRTQLEGRRTAIIAYVFARIILNEMHILRIAVASDYQDRGVASWLLQHCFKLAKQKQVGAVDIEVRSSNTSAIALYHNAGFQQLGTRPNYYPETGEDALVMVKHLKELL
jgi:ribosomal-protein-alanine N-acetyltransferase